jgi:hypothetical protein
MVRPAATTSFTMASPPASDPGDIDSDALIAGRTLCHAKRPERLEGHLELLRCHYNSIRRHRALKFGKVMKTPAMQAGLTTTPLTFRVVFMATARMGFVVLVIIEIRKCSGRCDPVRMAA